MRLTTSTSLLATLSLTSSCTFSINAHTNTNAADGSSGDGCEINIWSEDLYTDDVLTTKPDATKRLDSCDPGCETLAYGDHTYEFCWSRFVSTNPMPGGTTITVQRLAETEVGGVPVEDEPGTVA